MKIVKESIQVIDTETLTLGGWDAVRKEGVTEAIDATIEKNAGEAEAFQTVLSLYSHCPIVRQLRKVLKAKYKT